MNTHQMSAAKKRPLICRSGWGSPSGRCFFKPVARWPLPLPPLGVGLWPAPGHPCGAQGEGAELFGGSSSPGSVEGEGQRCMPGYFQFLPVLRLPTTRWPSGRLASAGQRRPGRACRREGAIPAGESTTTPFLPAGLPAGAWNRERGKTRGPRDTPGRPGARPVPRPANPTSPGAPFCPVHCGLCFRPSDVKNGTGTGGLGPDSHARPRRGRCPTNGPWGRGRGCSGPEGPVQRQRERPRPPGHGGPPVSPRTPRLSSGRRGACALEEGPWASAGSRPWTGVPGLRPSRADDRRCGWSRTSPQVCAHRGREQPGWSTTRTGLGVRPGAESPASCWRRRPGAWTTGGQGRAHLRRVRGYMQNFFVYKFRVEMY